MGNFAFCNPDEMLKQNGTEIINYTLEKLYNLIKIKIAILLACNKFMSYPDHALSMDLH